MCLHTPDGWRRKKDCEIARDFAPQLTEKGWDDSLGERTGGHDGREDIANTIAFYVYGGNRFREEAKHSSKMMAKYLYLKNLFGGNEYGLDSECTTDAGQVTCAFTNLIRNNILHTNLSSNSMMLLNLSK
ncbi:MAG: hypothetical protein ACE5FT_06780 [Candidatus Nanoarchaeia archaeon]